MLSFIRVPRLLKHNVRNHIIGCLIYTKSYFNLDKLFFKISLNAGRALAALSVILVCFTSLFSLSASASSNWKPGQILVSPKPGLSKVEFDKVLGKYNGKSKSKISKLNVHIVSVPEKAEQAIVRALSNNPHIDFAELDELVAPSEIIANDTYYTNAWHLAKMNLPTAWQESQGDGVVVAVLDTGVNSGHPDLAGKLVAGWNSVSQNTDISDVYGHGTKVAGVIAAVNDNNLGVTSIAWNSKVMPIKISNQSNGSAYRSDTAAGLTWAADHGADIVNISYSITESDVITSAAQYFHGKGGLVVASAGNSGAELTSCNDNPYIITVSATGSNDVKTSWSNYGNCIDVAAPGAGIWTTNKDGAYSSVSGTSFSAPAVAATLALIKSKYLNVTNTEIENILESSTNNDISGVNFSNLYGHGRVDAAASLTTTVTVPDVDQIAPIVSITSPAEDSVNNGNVVVQVDAQDNIDVTAVDLYLGGNKLAQDTTSPFSFTIDTNTLENGQIAIQAHAFDSANNVGTSGQYWIIVDNVVEPEEPVVIEDTTAPTLNIVNLTDGQTISGTQSIQVTAQDNVSVSKIQLFIDSELKYEISATSLSYSWNTRKVNDGNHTITARVYDSSNNMSEDTVVVEKLTTVKTRGGKKRN